MTSYKIVFGAVMLAATLAAGAEAQSSASHTVAYSVSAINQIAVTGSPSLSITTATAGSSPSAVSDATSSWAITTNQTTKKLTASINTAMPSGVTLEVSAAGPSGATGTGFQTLGTSAVDVVTGISQVAGSGLALTYRLSATLAAGAVSSASKTVTYTLVTGP
jgi:hypothetical protein